MLHCSPWCPLFGTDKKNERRLRANDFIPGVLAAVISRRDILYSEVLHLPVCVCVLSVCLQPMILTLLDITPMMASLGGVVMELQDCALTLLQGMLGGEREGREGRGGGGGKREEV